MGRMKLEEKMSQIMASKIMNVEFFYLENPYYLDLKKELFLPLIINLRWKI